MMIQLDEQYSLVVREDGSRLLYYEGRSWLPVLPGTVVAALVERLINTSPDTSPVTQRH
jgi:hypothetical protein